MSIYGADIQWLCGRCRRCRARYSHAVLVDYERAARRPAHRQIYHRAGWRGDRVRDYVPRVAADGVEF